MGDIPRESTTVLHNWLILVWFDFCFTALQHNLGHFERGQLL